MHKLSRHQLLDIAMSRQDAQACADCAPLCCPGWISVPSYFDHYPYDRSDVRECAHCRRAFLHYTEYGGYYLDERIRALNPKYIV